MAHGYAGARPTATCGAAHAHGTGAARVRGPRPRGDGPAWPRWAQRARPNLAGPRGTQQEHARVTRLAVLHGDPTAAPHRAREMAEEAGGSPALGRQHGTTVTGKRRGSTVMDERRRLRTAAVRTAVRGARLSGGWRTRRGRDGAVGTPTRVPGSTFNALERRGARQPRGNGALPRGPGAARGG
jgi:hypothetical protein